MSYLYLSLSVSLSAPRASLPQSLNDVPRLTTTRQPLSPYPQLDADWSRPGCWDWAAVRCASHRDVRLEREAAGLRTGVGVPPPGPHPSTPCGGGAGDISANYDAPFASITKRQPIGVSASPHPLPLHTWQCMVGSAPGGWPLAD